MPVENSYQWRFNWGPNDEIVCAYDPGANGIDINANVDYVALPDHLRLCELVDAPPVMPEADWSKAPDTAQFWAIDADGRAFWYLDEPHIAEPCWYDATYQFAPKVDLPIGIDWRTTLRKRPAAQGQAGE